MAGIFTKYRVVLDGTIVPEADRKEVLNSLARIFNSSPQTMESLLQGQPVSLKKEYMEDDARLICRKIQKAGAQCRIEEIPEVELDILSESTLLPVDDRDFGSAVDRDGYGDQGSNRGQDVLFDLMMTYVNRNVDFYSPRFQKFGNPRNPKFRLTWNWPALFFFFPWALYRKMWVYAAFYVVGGMGLALYTPSMLMTLLWWLVWPAIANYLYFNQAAGAVRAAIAQPGAEKKLATRGGVSRLAVVIGLVILMLVSSYTSNMVAERFMEQYGERLEDVLPGSGTQTRGDGSAVQPDSDSDTPLGRTSLTLSYLATSLKILLVTNEDNKNQKAIDEFVARLENGSVKDDWGNSIKIESDPSGYRLRSAGPDHSFGTGDDLVQRVSRE